MNLRYLIFALYCIPTAGISAEIDFAHDVLPILKERCAKCHTDGKYKGSFSMDTREAILKSDAVVVGKSGESLFIEQLTLEDPDDRMPQKADPLPPEEVAMLTRWVDEGLAWEPGFTFKGNRWVAPLAPRLPELPPSRTEGENPIDRIARAYFEENKLAAPAPISDAAFLRRASLDLVGVLPSPAELAEFLGSEDAGRRGAKVAELLDRNVDYADHWMSFWNDLLRNDYAGTGFIDGGRKQITGWLYAALHDNKPYDQFVRELLSPTPDSEGFVKGIKWRGNVNASQVREVQFAQNVSQVFFGENLKCASCHDSFINDWKLADAYGMAAIISDRPLELHRCDKPTGEIAEAKFLFSELGEVDPKASTPDRLKRVAELATSKENGRLARTVVNRIWARLMGLGLVEPVDVMSNRPWSEDMLDFLAWDLAENGYDLKRTLSLILNSRTYQSAVVNPPGEAEDYVFQGPIAKRMTAEQFIDAVWEITGTAPGKIQAGVKREAKASPAGGGEAGRAASGKWIWSAKGNRPAGERVVFAKDFELPQKLGPAFAVITCDNEYTLSINGKRVGGDANWENVERFDVTSLLKPGNNSIRVDAKNLGGGRDPAALYFYLRVDGGDGKVEVVSDEKWRAGDGVAVVIAGPWAAGVGPQIAGLISGKSAGANRLRVRASLVNSTLLMRALGRPNREQVVTTRPADLTTLQALELNDGAEFVGYLDRGASKLAGAHAGDADSLIEDLYLTALSRPPSEMERAVGGQMLGEPMTKESVADLLWTVLMLPEFQFVQ